jgi:hypothetical protein
MKIDKFFFRDDPFSSLYNLEQVDTVILTMDIDWAPEYATQKVLDLVSSSGLNITAFATHRSPLLLDSEQFVEIGLHPDNTRPHPKYGFTRKISDLLEIYPKSQGIRCHRNFFGQNISDLARASNLKYDASTILWKQPFAQIYLDYNGLVKIPYTWEDGIHLDLNLPLNIEQLDFNSPGLKVFNVHPMLIYLNAPSDELRRRLTRGIKDLTVAPEHLFSSHVFNGYGVQSFYKDFLGEIVSRKIKTIFMRDVAELASGDV